LPFAGVTGSVTPLGTVPEPSTLLLGVIGFGMLFGWQRGRRRAEA
jgi:MYXO-CTERM domain-containing protein